MLIGIIKIIRCSLVYRLFCLLFCISFVFTGTPAWAQVLPYMPPPGQMITPALKPFDLPYIVGMRFSSDNIFNFTFFLNRGNSPAQEDILRREVDKVGKYFLAALTIPEKDLWVNLSPYEQNRIITPELSRTDLGKDLLGEDYVLKQLASSLTYPDSESGKAYWNEINNIRVGATPRGRPGQAQGPAPTNSFTKIWIVPGTIKMKEASDRVVITEATLKVMTEEDYLATQKNGVGANNHSPANQSLSQAMRNIIVPIIEKEVNTGKHFAHLRQVYRSIILAGWFKKKLKDTIMNQVYFNQKKTLGAENNDPALKEKIYSEYVKAFNQGVYKVVKSQHVGMKITKRQYFSGGVGELDRAIHAADSAEPAGSTDALARPAVDVLEAQAGNVEADLGDQAVGPTGAAIDGTFTQATGVLVSEIRERVLPRVDMGTKAALPAASLAQTPNAPEVLRVSDMVPPEIASSAATSTAIMGPAYRADVAKAVVVMTELVKRKLLGAKEVREAISQALVGASSEVNPRSGLPLAQIHAFMDTVNALLKRADEGDQFSIDHMAIQAWTEFRHREVYRNPQEFLDDLRRLTNESMPIALAAQAPSASGEGVKFVTLKNGAVAPEQLVSTVRGLVDKLVETNPFLAYELVTKAREPGYKLHTADKDELGALSFIDRFGNVPDSTRDIILSMAEGEGLEMTFGSPVKPGSDAVAPAPAIPSAEGEAAQAPGVIAREIIGDNLKGNIHAAAARYNHAVGDSGPAVLPRDVSYRLISAATNQTEASEALRNMSDVEREAVIAGVIADLREKKVIKTDEEEAVARSLGDEILTTTGRAGTYQAEVTWGPIWEREAKKLFDSRVDKYQVVVAFKNAVAMALGAKVYEMDQGVRAKAEQALATLIKGVLFERKANTGGFDFAGTQNKSELTVMAGGLKLSGDKAAAYLANGKVAGFRLAILALRY